MRLTKKVRSSLFFLGTNCTQSVSPHLLSRAIHLSYLTSSKPSIFVWCGCVQYRHVLLCEDRFLPVHPTGLDSLNEHSYSSAALSTNLSCWKKKPSSKYLNLLLLRGPFMCLVSCHERKWWEPILAATAMPETFTSRHFYWQEMAHCVLYRFQASQDLCGWLVISLQCFLRQQRLSSLAQDNRIAHWFRTWTCFSILFQICSW